MTLAAAAPRSRLPLHTGGRLVMHTMLVMARPQYFEVFVLGARRQVIWACSQMSSAMAVPFTGLIMHAVASASEAFPRDSIYMQLDGAQAPLDDADDAAPEVRLVPSDASAGVSLLQPSLPAACCLHVVGQLLQRSELCSLYVMHIAANQE